VEVSIHELLAAAREAVKSDYIKGESILCETRYHPDTHYMVEIEMLKTDNTLGEKGAYIRKFLTEDEYSAMLQKQEEHLIKIKRQAIVQKGTLRYIPKIVKKSRPLNRSLPLSDMVILFFYILNQ